MAGSAAPAAQGDAEFHAEDRGADLRCIGMLEPLAHVDNSGRTHRLDDHLAEIGRMAASFASAFNAEDWARLAGIWHDLGKYREGFQKYIRQTGDPDSHIEGKVGGRDKTHPAAGASHAMQVFTSRFGPPGETAARLLAYAIAGHHAGLADWTAGLDNRLLGTRAPDNEREYREARDACVSANPRTDRLQTRFGTWQRSRAFAIRSRQDQTKGRDRSIACFFGL